MEPASLAFAGLLCFFAALLFANLGLGGGLLYVPILLALASSDEDVVAPLSLAMAAATASMSVVAHARGSLVDARLALAMIPAAVVGGLVGASFNLATSKVVFLALYLALLVAVVLAMALGEWRRPPREADDDRLRTRPRVAATSGATFVSGFLSGALAVGGGLFNVPLLTRVLGRRTRVAVGTSSLVIVPTAALGVSLYLAAGEPLDPVAAVVLLPLVLIGGFLGATLGLRRLSARTVTALFLVVVALAALRIAWELAIEL